MESIGIGLAGFGTVGGGVYKNLESNRALLTQRLGASFEIRRIAVRDLEKPRPVEAPAELFTTDLDALIADPEIKVVVELMGGIDVPLAFVRKALEAGKIVITGNKALLAEHGAELFALAREKRVPIFYEAAVAGGIPIIKTVREALIANRFESIHGILNGTSNYILTRMTEAGLDFAPALAEAQQLGYAEADPTLDINGWDAAHKAIILASLAYGFWVQAKDIHVAGIDRLTGDDIRFAAQLGYAIKLLATIKADASDEIEVRVCPTLIPKSPRPRLGEGRVQCRVAARRRRRRGALLRTWRGTGPDREFRDRRPRRNRRRAQGAAPLLRLHLARPLRKIEARRAGRLAILPPPARG